MKLFKVGYAMGWDGDEPSTGWDMSVVADDAEQAVAAVKAAELGKRTPKLDDNDKEIEGEFTEVTGWKLESVKAIADVDIVAPEVATELTDA